MLPVPPKRRCLPLVSPYVGIRIRDIIAIAKIARKQEMREHPCLVTETDCALGKFLGACGLQFEIVAQGHCPAILK